MMGGAGVYVSPRRSVGPMECPAYTLTSGGLQQTADDAVESQASRLPLAAVPQRRSQTTLLSTDCPPCNDAPQETIPTAGGLLTLQAYIALCPALGDALQGLRCVSAAQRCGCTGDFVCLDIIDEGGVADAIHEWHPLEAISCLRRVLQALQAVRRSTRSHQTFGMTV